VGNKKSSQDKGAQHSSHARPSGKSRKDRIFAWAAGILIPAIGIAVTIWIAALTAPKPTEIITYLPSGAGTTEPTDTVHCALSSLVSLRRDARLCLGAGDTIYDPCFPVRETIVSCPYSGRTSPHDRYFRVDGSSEFAFEKQERRRRVGADSAKDISFPWAIEIDNGSGSGSTFCAYTVDQTPVKAPGTPDLDGAQYFCPLSQRAANREGFISGSEHTRFVYKGPEVIYGVSPSKEQPAWTIQVARDGGTGSASQARIIRAWF
jgi:hypothetical protein